MMGIMPVTYKNTIIMISPVVLHLTLKHSKPITEMTEFNFETKTLNQ